MKRYTTFEEIDRDLKYLKLKSQIDKEELKLSVTTTKEDFKDTFSPISIIGSMIGSIAQKALIVKIANSILGVKKVKEVKDPDE
ncbi:hypothetical protein INR76_04080 [Marixanthomonas sp. SCSIO 43207]|uniref:DUF6327 family protein n=1 Tax=Marixanthomonas sp. SCSIO 43207 TaxID=2779360 RepID=UPI001CA7BC86|nr:DUF6327 family protein [Marixanthomonas sp. SCSIO 43207]UAB81944.1 hypothetical protein INR76_04080 [Marixanthomonas sp. SCSIO 43207]